MEKYVYHYHNTICCILLYHNILSFLLNLVLFVARIFSISSTVDKGGQDLCKQT